MIGVEAFGDMNKKEMIALALNRNTKKVSRLYWVPYQVERVEIDGVLDLRQPDTRTWFHKTFEKGPDELFSKPNGVAPSFLHSFQR